MMRSLYSGVSGLRTHQTKMDVIGNNIANVNTVAYKSSSVTFGELMYQTSQNASGPNALTGTGGINAKQIGLGVQNGAINSSISQAGASQTTGNPYDLQIKGDSFFIVSDGANNYFTRAGAFYVDGGGNLAMTSNGYNVMGWGVDESGLDIKKDTVTALRIMSEANMTYPAEATSKAYIGGVLDRNDPDVNSENGKIMNLKIYDNLGFSYTAKLSMKAMEDSVTTGKYTVELVDVLDSSNKSVKNQFPGLTMGTVIDVPGQKELKVANGYTVTSSGFTYTDAAGASVTCNFTTDLYDTAAGEFKHPAIDKLAAAYGYEGKTDAFLSQYVTVGTAPNTTNQTLGDLIKAGTFGANAVSATDQSIAVKGKKITGATVEYDVGNGNFKGINGSATTTSLQLIMNNNGQNRNFSDIEIDFQTSAQADKSGASTIAAFGGTTKNDDGKGRKLGEMSKISIDTNGKIYASYTNGMSRLLGQIAVAQFANASGLEKMGENLYQATLNSGQFDGIGVDITADNGAMNTGQLEMSNVDLSAEFTEMITTQRGFQANSRIITVSDTLLEELVNLKR